MGGLLGAAAGLVTGGSGGDQVEERPAFGEIAASGRLVLHPHLKGYTKVDVRALELVNFRGQAVEAGVDLSDGVLDTEVDVRFRGEDGLSVQSKTTLSYLSVSEPPGGPISSLLVLPAPLDTVLYVLRDENQEQVIPLNFKMGTEGLSGGAVAGAAISAVGRLVGEAIASSPVRIIGGVLDFAGLDQEQEPVELNSDSVALGFAPGETALGVDALAVAAPLFEAMRRDAGLVLVVEHRLGAGDLARAARLSNPSLEDCLELARRLRQSKFEQLARRDAVAGEVRARYAIGQLDAAAGLLEDLRGLDRQLASTEAALDQLHELLRPGAERRRDRRVRAAALAVAQLRLDAVRRALLAARVPSMPVRIQLRRPRFELADGASIETGNAPEPGDAPEPAGGVVTLTPLRRR